MAVCKSCNYHADIARASNSKCGLCGKTIDAGSARVQIPGYGGDIWVHLDCMRDVADAGVPEKRYAIENYRSKPSITADGMKFKCTSASNYNVSWEHINTDDASSQYGIHVSMHGSTTPGSSGYNKFDIGISGSNYHSTDIAGDKRIGYTTLAEGTIEIDDSMLDYAGSIDIEKLGDKAVEFIEANSDAIHKFKRDTAKGLPGGGGY